MADPVPARVPREVTSFVGRETEIAEIVDRFARGGRLVTLLGAPGAGKTRLAIRLATQALPSAVFCAVAGARTVEEIASAVGHVLAMPGDAIDTWLAQQEALLVVLDELEEALSPAAELLERWLTLAPRARFLATSRSPLHLPAETCIEIGPLTSACAITLYRERALAVRGGPVADSTEVITALTERLDRLPLAIELAASRARVLGAGDFLARIESRLDLLRAKREAFGSRHRALRDAIDTSWEALGDAERRGLARASVFQASFSLPAFEHVVGPGPRGTTAVDVLEALCEASLVVFGRTPAAQDHPRFYLYENIRAYAAEKLDELGDTQAALALHTGYFARHAADISEAHGRPRAEVLALLALDARNIAAACEQSLPGDAAEAARLALSLDPLVRARGPLRSHAERITRVLAAPGSLDDFRLRGLLLVARAHAHSSLGDVNRALADVAEAQRIVDVFGHGDIERQLLAVLSVVMISRGQFDEGLQRLPPLVRDIDPDADLLFRSIGIMHLARGSMEQALDSFSRGLALARAHSDENHEAALTALSAVTCHELGRLDEAREGLQRALALARKIGDTFVEGVARHWYGLLCLDEGDTVSARPCLEASRALLETMGDDWFHRSVVGYTGVLEAHAGGWQAARALLTSAVARARREGDHYRFGVFLANLGAVLARLGESAAARDAFAEARAHAAHSDSPNLLPLADVLESFLDPSSAAARLARAEPIARRSSDVRHAIRLVLPLVDADPLVDVDPRRPPRPEGRHLLVAARDGSWFEVDGAGRCDLSRRAPLRQVLTHLIAHHARDPRLGVSTASLLEAGWPSERISHDAGMHRVHVAIATLRRLGLGDRLVKQSDGYRLDADVQLGDA
ncbi:hypothetical protein [Chondromyces apiculatus]|uniref:AAA+ ATPase domain-containing protein n=1 Tax=Chondromyces apiculatus DSM 436 TaxID=1192034 RepID=A0A017T9P9_9BACT|nr:hypothetical protein [Chondromyces apiculatus]EYF05964.1 Hypothetical protein CAP_2423 [Chondromyces apiculatus DSM 436]